MGRISNIAPALKSVWMKIAGAIGWFNTRLLLSIVYFVLFALPAVALKLIGKDPLDRQWKRSATTHWNNKATVEHSIENAKHQF